MKTIDLESWPRREHFAFFRRMDLPFYNVNANVDISGLRQYAKANVLSFSTVLIHRVVRALNAVDNFRYRLRGDQVVLHDRLNPAFAHLRPGEELFSMLAVDFDDDVFAFARAVQARIAGARGYFDVDRLKADDDFVFISALPWISFTGIDHTLGLNKDDAIPRVSWGKYFASGDALLLPFNIQVNHIFVDGIHVGRFFAALACAIGELAAPWRAGDLNPTHNSRKGSTPWTAKDVLPLTG